MSLPADLRRPLYATALRIRVQRAMDAGTILALAGLGLAAVILTLVKTGALADGRATVWLAAAAVLPIAGMLFGALRPIGPLLAAKLLDRTHGLADRMSNAVSFSAINDRTPFMSAAIDDAVLHAKKLSAKRAMPLRLPSDLFAVGALGIAVAFLAFLEVPRVIEERSVVGGGIVPVSLHEDDLEAFDSGLRDLIDDPRTPDDVRAAAQDFNRLIEDLADERLDRAESLRRIAELEQQLSQVQPADAEQLRESLEQLGEAMERSELAEALSEAMREGDAERSEAEMRALAERLRQEQPNRAELEQLRQALARAAQQQRPDCTAEIARMEAELAQLRAQAGEGNARTITRHETELEARRAECDEQQRQDRQEELQRLLQRQREQNQQSEQDRRLLQRRERELDRLRRESQQAQEQRRQLDRLQRQMDRSAEQLNREQQDQQEAAEQMDQGAEELNRMAQQQMSEEEMQRMRQQLEELRELIRRQREQQQQAGQNGQRQQQGQGQGRMDRFVLRARGQGEGEGIGIQRPGQGGQQGQQQGQGQGQGEGQGQEGQQQMLTLGGEGGNAMLEIPGMGGEQQGGQSGQGRAQQGPGAGEGHDPTTLDDPSLLGGERQTVRVEGQQGDGPVRSDVEIYTGAQRGFTSQGYRDVHTRYEGHAEEVLERDQVPPGYRFYVRRYFQLIRPREQ